MQIFRTKIVQKKMHQKELHPTLQNRPYSSKTNKQILNTKPVCYTTNIVLELLHTSWTTLS
jgi:hypothetical protein